MTKEIAEMWADILDGNVEKFEDIYIVSITVGMFGEKYCFHTARECFREGVKREIE